MIQRFPGSKPRRAVASYSSYAEAQQAVDHLADEKFPVENVAIVAEGISLVEQVTGRLGWGQAALNGASAGAVTGALIGFIWGLFSLIQPVESGLMLALYGIGIGAVIGALIGLLFYALSGGRRDFTSHMHVQASSYTVLVEDELADRAAQLLQSRV
jgi:hypothetical protein